MGWVELQLVVDRELLPRASDTLFSLGASGLQEDHLPGEAPAPRQPWDTGPPPPASARVLLRAWFEDPDEQAIITVLTADLPELAAHSGPVWTPVVEQDWDAQWRAGFTPIRISDRLTVAPPWDAPDGAVLIEPGRGFGSGQHTTTRQALQALDMLAEEVGTVLDVGCGSGVLALAAASLGLSAEGIDIDEEAVQDAQENAARNGISLPFSTAPLHAVRGSFDLVLANLYAEVLLSLADELVTHTGRYLVLAGVLADREQRVCERFARDLTLVRRDLDGEWVCLVWCAEGSR